MPRGERGSAIKSGISRDAFKAATDQAGVNVSVGYNQTAPFFYPIYTELLTYGRGCPIACPLQMRQMEYKEGLCPIAEELIRESSCSAQSGRRKSVA